MNDWSEIVVALALLLTAAVSLQKTPADNAPQARSPRES